MPTSYAEYTVQAYKTSAHITKMVSTHTRQVLVRCRYIVPLVATLINVVWMYVDFRLIFCLLYSVLLNIKDLGFQITDK